MQLRVGKYLSKPQSRQCGVSLVIVVVTVLLYVLYQMHEQTRIALEDWKGRVFDLTAKNLELSEALNRSMSENLELSDALNHISSEISAARSAAHSKLAAKLKLNIEHIRLANSNSSSQTRLEKNRGCATYSNITKQLCQSKNSGHCASLCALCTTSATGAATCNRMRQPSPKDIHIFLVCFTAMHAWHAHLPFA